ncbi:Competence protein F homolog, phosphoribosyltransferase domain; protein YhgH required for utilization of DNA as sole source of carbon and energy [hydrothermal vent metagenome]|uniref:Competence protein F homolog, phosphoribosyltransferase domain protein YhgH required for utilization of DNA as sole source of carbon and energy n=1 Tax=hydrothermal vent metagenome TaxID=652676 RepID=A0A3B0ZSE0_9ZZZZ
MLEALIYAMKQWANPLSNLAITCPLCSEPSTQLICPSCTRMLPEITAQCFQCGLPLNMVDTSHHALRCGQCVKTPPAFDLCISPYPYALPINQFITQLKFQHKLYYAQVLAELLMTKIEQHAEGLPDCIIPVPLHKKRLRQRGFNQALEIARPIAKRYAIKLDVRCCTRVVSTTPQMGQTKKARQKNIRHAFKVSPHFQYKHIAIVDDVMTTGQTVNELARVLRKQGAKRIQIWSAARA